MSTSKNIFSGLTLNKLAIIESRLKYWMSQAVKRSVPKLFMLNTRFFSIPKNRPFKSIIFKSQGDTAFLMQWGIATSPRLVYHWTLEHKVYK